MKIMIVILKRKKESKGYLFNYILIKNSFKIIILNKIEKILPEIIHFLVIINCHSQIYLK